MPDPIQLTTFKYIPNWSEIVNVGGVEKQLMLFSNNYAVQVQVLTSTIYLITIKMYMDKVAVPPYLIDPLGLPVTIPAFQKVATVSAVNTVLDLVKALTSVLS